MESPAGTATDNNRLTTPAQLTPIAFRTPAFQKLVLLCQPVVPATSQLIANPVFHVLIITVKTQLVVVVQLTTAAFQELLVQLHLILALPSLELHALIIISAYLEYAATPRQVVSACKLLADLALLTLNVSQTSAPVA